MPFSVNIVSKNGILYLIFLALGNHCINLLKGCSSMEKLLWKVKFEFYTNYHVEKWVTSRNKEPKVSIPRKQIIQLISLCSVGIFYWTKNERETIMTFLVNYRKLPKIVSTHSNYRIGKKSKRKEIRFWMLLKEFLYSAFFIFFFFYLLFSFSLTFFPPFILPSFLVFFYLISSFLLPQLIALDSHRRNILPWWCIFRQGKNQIQILYWMNVFHMFFVCFLCVFHMFFASLFSFPRQQRKCPSNPGYDNAISVRLPLGTTK